MGKRDRKYECKICHNKNIKFCEMNFETGDCRVCENDIERLKEGLSYINLLINSSSLFRPEIIVALRTAKLLMEEKLNEKRY